MESSSLRDTESCTLRALFSSEKEDSAAICRSTSFSNNCFVWFAQNIAPNCDNLPDTKNYVHADQEPGQLIFVYKIV